MEFTERLRLVCSKFDTLFLNVRKYIKLIGGKMLVRSYFSSSVEVGSEIKLRLNVIKLSLNLKLDGFFF